MRKKIDKIREERIEMEIVVDAYGESERAMSWHYDECHHVGLFHLKKFCHR